MHRPGSDPRVVATCCLPAVGSVLAGARALARPLGLLKRVLLIEVAGTEVLELRGVATQPEAGGQVGEVPVAVS